MLEYGQGIYLHYRVSVIHLSPYVINTGKEDLPQSLTGSGQGETAPGSHMWSGKPAFKGSPDSV